MAELFRLVKYQNLPSNMVSPPNLAKNPAGGWKITSHSKCCVFRVYDIHWRVAYGEYMVHIRLIYQYMVHIW
jgi:hypothetical protein